MLIKEILEEAIKEFVSNKIEEPVLKARIIISSSLGKEKEYLITHDTDIISDNECKTCLKNIKRVLASEPIQYITGYQEFMKLKFMVNKNVLIPRADTEVLVQEVISLSKHKDLKILDLCTGSGAIAISLDKYLSNCEITASDIDHNALKVAEKNNMLIGTNVRFIKSDLFENIKEKFDIIVSNPPYIESSVIKKLSKEVQNEPLIALDGGEDGLDIYKKIIAQSHVFLNKNGFLCLEIGYNQKDKVINLLKNQKGYRDIYSKQDFYGNNRIIISKLEG